MAACVHEASAVGLACHPKGDGRNFGYGTAGFRAPAEGLDHVLFRVGLLAAIRSKFLSGRAVGVMVTASHNAEVDNGVKIVEPSGEMMPEEWEPYATDVANAPDDQLWNVISGLAATVGADLSVPAVVVVGRDTRVSSPALSMAVCDGVGVMQPAGVRSLGIVTTPQLHYIVKCMDSVGAYGEPTLIGYADKLLSAFERLAALRPLAECKKYTPAVIVDCANGVGAVAVRQMLARLEAATGGSVTMVNQGGPEGGPLNDGCGADFVKVKQAAPRGVSMQPGQRMASFDGDADRIVYGLDQGGFKLLDGDRIALLLAYCTALWLKEAEVEGLRLGCVQTAYANGASTEVAVRSVGADNVLCAKTGVKHCHHAALVLDIGIYFEANGHGTVIFSDRFVQQVSDAAQKGGSVGAAAGRLLLLRDVINETVGDAFSIFLAVEALLRFLDWSADDWFALYSDLPCRQVKVVVADRSAIETTNAERTCTKPDGLQAIIDGIAAQAPKGRAFVRPSGTEDVVRVYAEAETVEAMLGLAQAVVDAVYECAGGTGPKPVVA